jgi:exodeoxyribonuclease V beta subunit
MGPERLDPMTLPLHGSRLIEASAGTGKTWTIAALYLRLVLGHGLARALPPGEILVMTFTRAATRELAERVRQRLVEAAACFRGEAVPKDDFLRALLDAHPPGAARDGAAWRLAAAAEGMDDAAVHTIDAWCQRMLREHAFDSGSLFDEELQADLTALRAEAVRDYWRQEVYPLQGPALDAVLALWSGVEALERDAGALLELPLAAPPGPLAACVAQALDERAALLAALKQGWRGRVQAMRDWLLALLEAEDTPFDRAKLKTTQGRAWMQALVDWAGDEALALPALTATARQRLRPDGLRALLKDGRELAVPPDFEALEALLQAVAALPDAGPALRSHAAVHIARRLQQLKAARGRWGFADMLQRLDAALDEATAGPPAQRLRQRILAQYPVALIDEFQDTSPLQLSIFDRLYRIADDEPARALLLIGDPKQSIYRFRGADIQSYLQARRATAGRHHVLGTNHRSTQALVAAVNGCFEAAEQRPGAGAFLFRRGEGDDGLPFEPVAAQGRAERFVGAVGDAPSLLLSLDATLRSKEASRTLHAALCAERIVQLLDDEQAGFVAAGEPFRRLCPADIAVLVRTRTEARAVRAALRQRGVASVYLSDQDSVLASPEARELLRLLQAVAAPRDQRLARAAWASPLLARRLDELQALADDESLFDAHAELLAQWQQLWQTQGVLTMLRRALHALQLPARWLAAEAGPGAGADGGERRLTNVLHLAELLQAASPHNDGEQALLRWLTQAIDEALQRPGGAAADEQVLRLESDAELVKVVTVHKSKGLEYPLVFLPFAAHYRAEDSRRTRHVELADASGRRHIDLAPDAAALAAADEERLREDLRLLYVALTRARHALWVGLAALKTGHGTACLWHRSAIGSLLSGAAPRTPQALADDVRTLAARVPGLHVEPVPEGAPPRTRLRPRGAAPPLQPARSYAGDFDRSWAVSSYSGLVRDLGTAAGEAPLRLLRDDEPAEAEPAQPRAAEQPWHRFPRGAYAGNFLHDQLEWLAGEGFALADTPALQQALRRRCERQGWGHRADDVLAWLQRVCLTPLPPFGAALAELQRAVPEMEFWLPSDGLRASAVDVLCRTHLLPGRPRPALPERALRGMLMGFADLVVAQGGRYAVLDYKSNALGTRDADYTPAAMQAAVLEHRYDVQAALYLLALHRLLRLRLGAAYRPAQQLRGAVFLFLRGINGVHAGCLHLQPPLALIEALDAMLHVVAEDTPR